MAEERYYPIEAGKGLRPPDYKRVVRALTDDELEEEILGKLGDPGYQLALLAEAEQRAKQSEEGS